MRLAPRIRGGLLQQYIVILVILVSGGLVTSGALEVMFSYQDTLSGILAVQREKATSAALRIEQFVLNEEQHVRYAVPQPWSAPTTSVEWRLEQYQQLLRVYPQGEQHCTTDEGEIPVLRSLSSVVFELPATRASELKVWVHRVSRDGYSEAWPARVELADAAGAAKVLEPMPGDGQRLTAIDGAPIRVTVSFPAQEAR